MDSESCMGMDGLRTYLIELRIFRRITQKQLSKAMGLSERALLDWESGKTQDLKSTSLIKAISFLRASFDDAIYLIQHNSTSIDGKKMAEDLITNTTNNRLLLPEQVQELLSAMDQSQIDQWIGYGTRLLEEKKK